MEAKYFGGWHRHQGRPVQPLSEAEARRRDGVGEAYCVVVSEGDGSRVSAFIEVADDYFSVNFLDERREVYLTYGFEDVGDQRLFLRQAIHTGTGGRGERAGTNYFFSQDGSMTIERVGSVGRPAEVSEGSTDVTRNWEPRPDFGDYRGLLRKERCGPAVSQG